MKELTIKNNYDITQPVQMVSMAKILKQHIVRQNLYVAISGKNYAYVEGWQFAGGLLGLYPRVESVENLSSDKEIKWKATVEIVNIKTDTIISTGFALCSNKENKKKTFDEYAILSMAQTRAIGKAYRNLIGWIMKLAGYEATPSEEMAKMGDEEPPKKIVKAKETPPQIEAECHECGNPITKVVAEYSKKIFKKQLCRNCQADKRNKK